MKKLIKSVLGELVWSELGQAKQEFIWRNIKDHSAPEISTYLNDLLDFSNGFYVEVGANDGRSFSNTYVLEKTRNWSGILVEPILHKHFESQRYRDASRNRFVYGACVDFNYSDPMVKLYYSNLMSTSDLEHGQLWAEAGSKFLNNGESVLPFWSPAIVLNQVIKEAGVSKIDFLSIDVEGAELSVLKGIDFEEIDIQLILIESKQNSSAISYLKKMNYSHIVNLGDNHFFKRQSILPVTF
jgi:FkbM family methyltransferase